MAHTVWVTEDREGLEGNHEYTRYDDAKAHAARLGHAVKERTYEVADSELVWTPDGSAIWPPGRTPEAPDVEWHVEGRYGKECGWETIAVEETEDEARDTRALYDREEPQYPHRVACYAKEDD